MCCWRGSHTYTRCWECAVGEAVTLTLGVGSVLLAKQSNLHLVFGVCCWRSSQTYTWCWECAVGEAVTLTLGVGSVLLVKQSHLH